MISMSTIRTTDVPTSSSRREAIGKDNNKDLISHRPTQTLLRIKLRRDKTARHADADPPSHKAMARQAKSKSLTEAQRHRENTES